MDAPGAPPSFAPFAKDGEVFRTGPSARPRRHARSNHTQILCHVHSLRIQRENERRKRIRQRWIRHNPLLLRQYSPLSKSKNCRCLSRHSTSHGRKTSHVEPQFTPVTPRSQHASLPISIELEQFFLVYLKQAKRKITRRKNRGQILIMTRLQNLLSFHFEQLRSRDCFIADESVAKMRNFQLCPAQTRCSRNI